ncbi:RHS repeat-associated core domain-containing protein, partial [Chromobacterium violaceum]
DETGLYDYGYRYYAPWLGRWLNPDPAGTVDGLNLYRMVKGNPIFFCDKDGLWPIFGSSHKEAKRIKNLSLSMMNVAIDILDRNESSAIEEVMLTYFNDTSVRARDLFKSNIISTRDFLKYTSMKKNVVMLNDKSSSSIAYVEPNEIGNFRYYINRVRRSERDFSGRELVREVGEAKKDYVDDLRNKFLTINNHWFNSRRNPDDYLASALIHEFSHAALNTSDFVYGYSRTTTEGSSSPLLGNPEPLFKLRAGKLDKSELALGAHQQAIWSYSSDNQFKLAESNADSFAYAIRALYSSQGDESQKKYYKRTVKVEFERIAGK